MMDLALMDQRYWCGRCDAWVSGYIRHQRETYAVRDQDVTLENVAVRYCRQCHSAVSDAQLDNATLERLYTAAGLVSCHKCRRLYAPDELAEGLCPRCRPGTGEASGGWREARGG